ncbi:spore gernimation protein GerA [Paenibacillus sp. BIHB 4019]|uniref:Spore gernimation protein GerA n=1 Tax=Paenibacillus sp. BIHB 4019 TaxID=1870819 RepID=A0A1B2DJ67_9BACL|nr:spore germination protein [Paenibacillus sp. BIHB 4019]ANY67767.1 spore gernimation protein GerA [Paenibacillus sp. BIHB 4019]
MANDTKLFEELHHNVKELRERIGHSPDVVIRSFMMGRLGFQAALIYIDGLVDKPMIHEQVLKPLLHLEKNAAGYDRRATVAEAIISAGEVKEQTLLDACVMEVLSGNTVLFLDGTDTALVIDTHGWERRSIEEPVSEAVVRGPRDGFTETLRSNTAMLRRRIKDPSFTMDMYKIGRRSQTDIALLYIKGLTDEALVEETRSRLKQIDIDEVLESGYIEQLVEDNVMSPFPQVQNTERPDRVAGALMEGRVAILVDGTPIALIVPVTFAMMMSSPEDYYERWLPSSLIRLLRYGAAFIALFLPSLYIALISYNHGLIPTKLAISIAAGREGVPFPSIVEALIMEITLEILREAGLRLPKPIGQAVGIVGGLVIGQAAVQAAIVSPIMVIVVALTAISSFAFPQYGAGLAIRILRFGMMMAAAVLGLYGVILFYILITVHMIRLKSFGVPYLSPFVPARPSQWKDLFLRFPLHMLKRRPAMVSPQDDKRQK